MVGVVLMLALAPITHVPALTVVGPLWLPDPVKVKLFVLTLLIATEPLVLPMPPENIPAELVALLPIVSV